MYGYMKPRNKLTQQDHEYPKLPVNAIVVPEVQPLFTEIEVNPQKLKQLLKEISNSCTNLQEYKRKYNVKSIIFAVCQHYSISLLEIVGNRRLKERCLARHVAFYLSRHLTTLSLPQIGRHFDNRDHTTVMHGEKRIERLLESDRELCADIYTIVKSLG